MVRNLALTLAVAVAVALAANSVMARGGGHGGGGHHGGGHHGGGHHGGGHHGGGHHGGEHHGGTHHGEHHANHHSSHHHSDHHHHAHFGNHNRPFSHGWNGNRGYGWGGWGGGWGNVWAPAAFGGAATWLGMEALSPATGGYAPVDTVYTADQGDEGDENPVAQSDDQDATEENTDNANETAQQGPAPSSEAAALAKNGATDPPKDAKLLPLGVYSIAPRDHTEASAMLQIAVSKDGVLRGSYCDLLSNQDLPIQGAVDKKTQRVAWTVGPKGKVLFETSLANLTQDKGQLSVHYEDGETRPWTIARYATEEAAKAAEAAAKTEPTSSNPVETKTGDKSQ